MGVGAIIGGGLGLVGSIIGGNSQKKAANKAADTSYAVAAQNNALAREIYGQNKAALTPYMQAGHPATQQLNAMLGLGTSQQRSDAQSDFAKYIRMSDYGFRWGEGTNALNSGYAGAGTLQSGAAMKGIENFRQDLQSGYRNEYMNLLGNQQGVGLGAASALAGVGQNHVNTISQNNNNAGTAAANAHLVAGANNPFANALGTIGGTILGRL